jgi:hypothetical protein
MSTLAKAGETAFANMEKINSELFSMTYGAFVVQILKDAKDVKAANAELEKIGHNIGVRLVDEFLAKSNVSCVGRTEGQSWLESSEGGKAA